MQNLVSISLVVSEKMMFTTRPDRQWMQSDGNNSHDPNIEIVAVSFSKLGNYNRYWLETSYHMMLEVHNFKSTVGFKRTT